MISFEEAKRIAFSVAGGKGLDSYTEYDEAWYIYNATEEWTGDPGVIVLKENGKTMTFFQFLTKYSPKLKEEHHKL